MLKLATCFSGGLAAPEFALRYSHIEHEVVFACEWDKYARQQYLHFHGKPQTFYNDVSDLDATQYKGQIDLFVWGSPCQDLSLAGKRKGFDGAKSSLFREGARVQSEMMPKVFIFENVKGLLSSNNGNDYKEVIKTFQDMGYLIATKVMNTKDFGVPQNRERVFIVGFLDENKYHAFNFPFEMPLHVRLRDILEDDVDEKYYLTQKTIDGFTINNKSDFKFEPHNKDDKTAKYLTARYYKMGKTDPYIKVKSATSKGYETATKEDSINFTHPDSKTRRGRVGKGVAQTLDCACNQGVVINPLQGKTKYGWHFEQKVYSEDSCTRALTASGGSGSREKVILNNYRIRKLTPTECYRLQGVKDEDIDLVVSNTQSYKIAGNAISVNVMQKIIENIYKNQTVNLFNFTQKVEVC